RTTTRRRNCWRATAATRSRRSSLTSPVALKARRRNERYDGARPAPPKPRQFVAADRGDDAALLVPVALVLAAAARPCLLADSTDGHLGFSAILYFQQCRLLRPCRRHTYWRGAAMGHFVPRPARF